MRQATRAQWIKCATAILLYLIFLIWVRSWWGLIVVPFIFDIYITKKIPWSFLEEVEESGCPQYHELGRRHRVCVGCCLLRQYLHLPELSDSFFFIGKIIAGGRLPVCEQDELRSPRTEHSPFHAVGAAYTACLQY